MTEPMEKFALLESELQAMIAEDMIESYNQGARFGAECFADRMKQKLSELLDSQLSSLSVPVLNYDQTGAIGWLDKIISDLLTSGEKFQ